MAKWFKIFFVLLFLPSFLSAQYDDIKFDHITNEQGLSNDQVRCVLQDKYGLIWIGTHDGLNKYDGYKFTIYRNDPLDSLSISSNFITALYEDQAGELWISTMGGGLNKFDRKQEQFISYEKKIDKPTKWKGLSATTMKQIAEYHYKNEKVLWIGTFTGLHKFDLETQNFRHYPHTDRGDPYSHIQTVAVDKAGMVWVGSLKGGVHKFSPKSEQFTHYISNPDNPNSPSDDHIMALYFDRNNILWIGTTEGGLNRFDPEKETFTIYKHDPNNPKSISSNNVRSIYEDQTGALWIGTADKGINIFHRQTQEFTRSLYDPNDPSSLSNNTVWCINEDMSGVLWIGTLGGVNKIVPRINQFTDYKKIPENPNSLSDNNSGPIYISTRGNSEILWIGTKRGLNKIDRTTGKYTHYVHDPYNPKSIPSNLINALFEDQSGILWIGTYGDGLIKFDPLTEQFKSYKDPNNIGANPVYSIFEDKYGLFWVGTYDGGLFKFNRDREIFTRVGSQAVFQMLEDSLDNLWHATWPGLRKYDRKTNRFLRFLRNPTAKNYPELNRTNCIIESHHGVKNVIWTGTFSGLNKFDRQSEQFTNYTVNDGLPNNVINGMLEDKHGNLWLSTNNGLSKFNPKTKNFRNYDVNDGLLGNQFSIAGCFKSKDGEMFFSSTKGVNAFFPDEIVDKKHIPNILITDFKLRNKSIGIKKDNIPGNSDTYYLNQHISLTKEITLSYKENVISFEFAALDFHSPQKNQYAYKMEGVDPEWVYTDASRRFATYTYLNPGEYIFHVKGSNNDGYWNEEGTSIKIIILPPWWRTNWAYIVYLLFILSMVYAVWRFQTNRLKMKHRLEIEHIHAEKLEEVDQMKSRFFANISHEFRTPLTLIQGPVRQMFSGEFSGNLKETYGMILRYSDRLLKLINQILDLSKLESGRMKLEVSCMDIVQFLRSIVQSFASLAERKKITLKFNAEPESISGYIDRDKLEKIVTNLLSNAFKFTADGGEVNVDLSLRGGSRSEAIEATTYGLVEKQSQLETEKEIATSRQVGLRLDSSRTRNDSNGTGSIEIRIFNSGAGIPPNQQDKIFDRFYQADESYTKDSEGSGIGLALTRELVEAHHGEIRVESELNKGTTFTVWVPIEREHFEPEEIVDIPLSPLDDLRSRREVVDPSKGEIEITPRRVESSTLEGGARKAGDVYADIQTEEAVEKPPPLKSAPLVLIVEDNPDVTSYISSFLEKDYRIISAVNGKEGLLKALAKFPDLIISDVMMPVMDGFELCRKLKSDERTSHIPVILLTAKADVDSKVEGLEFGADDYVTKPFDARELDARAKNLIEQRKMLREKFSRMIEVKPDEIAAKSMDEQFFRRLLDVFEDHMAQSDFSTEDFAREVGMSRTNLHMKLKALTNQPTHEFLRTLRLKRAAQLLRKSAGNVTEIAYAVGFNNPSYFSRIFRQQFGQTPSEFASKNPNIETPKRNDI